LYTTALQPVVLQLLNYKQHLLPALDTTALQPGGVQEDLLYFGAKLLNPSTIFSTHLNI
jgi:hypothetical protein